MIRSTQGIVHGKTIELVEDLGVADGQRVEVQIKLIPVDGSWGAGLRRCAGALAGEWSDEDDRILAEIHDQRKQDRRKGISE